MEGPLRFETPAELAARVGTEVGVSDWITIDQASIDAFATLTGDRYFIHVDPERAAQTMLGGSVAHGFLTLSQLSRMAYQAVPGVAGTKTGLNYGFDRLRFIAPVPAGARVRGRFTLRSFEVRPDNRWQAMYEVTVEIEGANKPALAAHWLHAGFL